MSVDNKFEPDWTVPPCEIIREDLVHRGLMLLEQKTDIDFRRWEQLLAGELPITVEVAFALSFVLGRSTETWLKIQRNYDEIQGQLEAGDEEGNEISDSECSDATD